MENEKLSALINNLEKVAIDTDTGGRRFRFEILIKDYQSELCNLVMNIGETSLDEDDLKNRLTKSVFIPYGIHLDRTGRWY